MSLVSIKKLPQKRGSKIGKLEIKIRIHQDMLFLLPSGCTLEWL